MVNRDKIGFLFPGQGAQFVGMGKDLYENNEKAKSMFSEANSILGYELTRYCFQGPEEELTKTNIAQPAIFVTSLAVLEILKNQYPDLKPQFAAGLSLGEFSALVAAGSLSFSEGLKLVAKRASAMEVSASNNPGTMASIVGLTAKECGQLAAEAGCEVANLNAPDQIVLSGTVESIHKACSLAEGMGAKRAIPLKVGGAFHSSLMRDAKEALEAAIQSANISSPNCTFVPNASAESVSDTAVIGDLLARQLMNPVRWVETMAQAESHGVKDFIEIGPGKVLKGLARRYSREMRVTSCCSIEDINKLESLFSSNEG